MRVSSGLASVVGGSGETVGALAPRRPHQRDFADGDVGLARRHFDGAQGNGGWHPAWFRAARLRLRLRAACLRAAAAALRGFPRRAPRPAIRARCAWPSAPPMPTRPTLVAEMALRPNNAPRIELPMDNAVLIFCCESWLDSRSRRSSPRRIWSWSCCSFACQRLRSSATAASRFSRAASARRVRKSPSVSSGLRGRLECVAPQHAGARRLVQMRLQRLGPAGVTRGAQCRARQLGVLGAFGARRAEQPRLELRIAGGRLPMRHCRRRHRRARAIRPSATRRARASNRRSAASRIRRPWVCRARRPSPSWGCRKYSRNARAHRGARGRTAPRRRHVAAGFASAHAIGVRLALLARAPSRARSPAR